MIGCGTATTGTAGTGYPKAFARWLIESDQSNRPYNRKIVAETRSTATCDYHYTATGSSGFAIGSTDLAYSSL